MEKIRKMEECADILGLRLAVVQVKLGESNEQAWKRHLKENPGDSLAMVKIFNQPRRIINGTSH